MIKLTGYLKNYKKEFIFGPAFKLFEAIFELIVPLVMADIIDKGIVAGNTAYVLKRGGILVALGVAGFLFALSAQYLAAKASQGFGTDLRNGMYRHINRLSATTLDEIGTSSLITRLTNDINQVQLGVAMFIRLVLRSPFLIVGAMVMAMLIDLKLSLIFLAVIPVIACLIFIIMKKSVPLYRSIQKKLDRTTVIARENLEGAKVIRAFGREEDEEQRFRTASDDLANAAFTVGKISALLHPVTFLVMNSAIIAILWFGGIRVNAGHLSQGQIIAFINYVTQILLSLIVFANLIVIFTRASASAARIREVLNLPESQEYDHNQAADSPIPQGHTIEFVDVSFSYSNDEKYALANLSVHIPAGSLVGIIGGTGSGKSTLVNLLPRLYEYQKGSLTFGGIELNNIPVSVLRQKIAIVPQKSVLFRGTLRENMLWGNPQASDEEIWHALALAQAKDFVEAAGEGLEKSVSRGGRNFSGGQRQRLCVARALIKQPEILVLDDSTSALDYATDAALRREISHNLVGTTVFMVSQRASSIKNADLIIVLEQGAVDAIGTHETLLQNSAIYREICLSQTKTGEVRA